MKKNSQKILLALYPTENVFPQLSLEKVKWLISDLTEDGQRSMIYMLEQKQLITSARLADETLLSITAHGKDTLEALFPALSTKTSEWNGKWLCIVFQTAPKTDPQFRYLRTFILSQKGIPFSRGMYLVPSVLSDSILKQCQDIYRDSVTVLSVDQWVLGSERPIVIEQYGLLDLLNAYSGISREINQLLGKFEHKKELTDWQKISLHNTYTRLIDTLAEDPGLVEFYFPGKEGGLGALIHFQQLLKL